VKSASQIFGNGCSQPESWTQCTNITAQRTKGTFLDKRHDCRLTTTAFNIREGFRAVAPAAKHQKKVQRNEVAHLGATNNSLLLALTDVGGVGPVGKLGAFSLFWREVLYG